ncbi:hypothetical protein K439DRAFT_963117 [Ramaria rubella]|nr:hypothetical protein K439DRAFT_963117 [Ramaria rubella]
MVVTRRQSAAPMPAVASRTNSSTGTSRSSKGKAVDKSASSPLKDPGAGPSRVPPNGTPLKPPPADPQVPQDFTFDDDVPSTIPKPSLPKSPSPKSPSLKSKPKSKSKKSSKAKRHNSNKGISIFDILARLFLLWFTIYTVAVCPEDVQLRSPVCRALTEYRRLVLEPYIYPPIRAALDHPSIAPHIQQIQPYYDRATRATTPLVRRCKHEWNTRAVPRIYWVQLRARPYILRAQRQYDVTLGPYVNQASVVVDRYKLMAEPYVTAATVNTQHKWKRVRPYVLPLWRAAKHVPGIVTRLVGKVLGDARRQWVDPQLTKIWDAVVEKGKADTVMIKNTPISVISQSISAASTSTSSIPLEASSIPPQTVSDRSDNAPPISLPLAPEVTDDAALSASSIIAETAPASISKTSTSVGADSEAISHQTSVVQSPFPEPTDEAAVSASSLVLESLSGPSQPSSEHSVPTSVESPLEDEGFENLDDFISEMGLDESDVLEPPPPPPSPPPPPVREETEEEKAERLRLKEIQTAEKRADIEARHDQWEIDVEKLGKARRRTVREALRKLRNAAGDKAREPGGAVRIHVDSLVHEAEKSLKSLKAYSRKLAGENKTDEEKIKIWQNAVSKVDKKFGERVDAAADGVRQWWGAHVDKELKEIEAISEEILELAYKAQTDVAMDYSWLADVSWEDWQRYHKLVDKAKEFGEIYRMMQNGTLANAPPNPVSDIMEALQEEVDDLILGFEASLDRLKSAALDTFSGAETAAESSTLTMTAGSDPEISILPIEPIVPEKKDAEIPPVILSRGAEEIKVAVSRAEEAKTQVSHEEL